MSRNVLDRLSNVIGVSLFGVRRYGYYRNRAPNVEVLTGILLGGNRNEPNDLLLPVR